MGSSAPPDLTRSILRHERAIVAGGIALLVVSSWWFLASGAGMPQHKDMGMEMGMAPPPLPALILMWWVMMVAMMLPSAAPAILLYARVRDVRASDATVARSWVFMSGYLGVWLLFSVAAAVAQLLLTGPAMAVADSRIASLLLVAAGLYQLSPIKGACLRQCRSPAQFISRHWGPGVTGALRLGALHGSYCVGCCWALMALLFVGGVMNFLWIVALTLLVGIEKLVPHGHITARIVGVGLVGWGLFRLIN